MTTRKPLIIMFILLLASSILMSIPELLASNSQFDEELPKIRVDNITHKVELLEGGLVVVNDTVTVSSSDGSVRTDFPIGFPHDFAPYLIKCFALTSENEEIPVVLDYGLGKPGFYGVLVKLTDLGEKFEIDSTPKRFTVTFIFSGLISMQDDTVTFNFTLFPSLATDAQTCNVTVIFPTALSFSKASFKYNRTTVENDKNHYFLDVAPLKKFTYEKAQLNLRVSETFPYIEIERLERRIEADVHGNIIVKDTYYVSNKGTKTISRMIVYFPKEGYDFAVENEIGLKISDVKDADLKANRLNIPVVGPNETKVFILTYKLNSTVAQSKVNGNFRLNISISKITPSLVRELAVIFVAPQGAELEISNTTTFLASSIKREATRDSIKFTLTNFTPFDEFQTEITYKLNIFWTSYPYTLIALVSGAAILIAAFAWKRPVPAPITVPKVKASPKIFRKFVESYGERMKIISRIERLEEQARKGRVSRREYKVRKRMLENKLSMLSKDLTDLKERIRHFGPRYADIIRQLEVAEAQLEEAEAGIRRLRSRYRRGEISREAYRRLLSEHEKRREEASVFIEGALLRLREEYQ